MKLAKQPHLNNVRKVKTYRLYWRNASSVRLAKDGMLKVDIVVDSDVIRG